MEGARIASDADKIEEAQAWAQKEMMASYDKVKKKV